VFEHTQALVALSKRQKTLFFLDWKAIVRGGIFFSRDPNRFLPGSRTGSFRGESQVILARKLANNQKYKN